MFILSSDDTTEKIPSIEEAYEDLTSVVEDEVLRTGDIHKLRRACVKKIRGLNSNLSKKLIPLIQKTSSVNGLLDVVTDSDHYNWFDIRLLEAITRSLGSTKAKTSLDNFKKNYYHKKICDHFTCKYEIILSSNSLKFVTIVEKYKKDPNKLTISDLQQHQYELEKVLEKGLDLLIIRTGCVELTWQIPQEHFYQVYTSMESKRHDLSSLAVQSLDCEEANKYTNLPFLWCGQQVGEYGYIKPLPEHVRKEPYTLPQGYQWVGLNSSDAKEVIKFCKGSELNLDAAKFHFITAHPHTSSEWQFSIRSTNGKLLGIVLAYPVCMSIGGASVSCVCPTLYYHKKYQNKRLLYMLFKELQRRANLHGIDQFVYIGNIAVLKPATTTTSWGCLMLPINDFDPSTPGWRKMTPEDIPSALAFVNNYSSQFEIKQVFTSEEEFSHHFLCPAVPNFVSTYIVKNDANNITDLVRYITPDKTRQESVITTVVSTYSPIRSIISDAMACAAKGNKGVTSVITEKYDIRKADIASSLPCELFSTNYYVYNYKYHEIPESNFWYVRTL